MFFFGDDDDDNDDNDDGTLLPSRFSLFFVAIESLIVVEVASALDTSARPEFDFDDSKLSSMEAEILDAVSVEMFVPVIGY